MTCHHELNNDIAVKLIFHLSKITPRFDLWFTGISFINDGVRVEMQHYIAQPLMGLVEIKSSPVGGEAHHENI